MSRQLIPVLSGDGPLLQLSEYANFGGRQIGNDVLQLRATEHVVSRHFADLEYLEREPAGSCWQVTVVSVIRRHPVCASCDLLLCESTVINVHTFVVLHQITLVDF